MQRRTQKKAPAVHLAVPRFVRVAERQIDNAAEVKPLPRQVPGEKD